MITGKNKERFKIFYETIKGGNYKIPYQNFMAYPFEMQQGVYLAYYDSLEIYIDVRNFMNCKDYFRFEINDSLRYDSEALPTRNEAYKEAFKQADKLENEKH